MFHQTVFLAMTLALTVVQLPINVVKVGCVLPMVVTSILPQGPWAKAHSILHFHNQSTLVIFISLMNDFEGFQIKIFFILTV